MTESKIQLIAVGFLMLVFTLVSMQRTAWGGGGTEKQSLTLDQVQTQYGLYEKYKDTGTLTVTYYENGEEIRASTLQFSTTFHRSAGFQISWQDVMRNGDLGLSYKIWARNGVVISQYGTDPPFQSASLREALSRAVGVSNSLTFYTPCLLMPKMNCFVCDNSAIFTAITGDGLSGSEQKIHVEYQSGNVETLWVNKNTRQISEIEWWNEIDKLRVHHQIAYTSVEAE